LKVGWRTVPEKAPFGFENSYLDEVALLREKCEDRKSSVKYHKVSQAADEVKLVTCKTYDKPEVFSGILPDISSLLCLLNFLELLYKTK